MCGHRAATRTKTLGRKHHLSCIPSLISNEQTVSFGRLFFLSSPNYRFVDVDKLEYDVGGSRFVIRRLRKYTKYEIVIQAVNTNGEGPLSNPSIGQTKQDGKPPNCHYYNSCSLSNNFLLPL
jgi:hypothetical protein